jgi:molybdopterin-guanine dinucleotide biosynthesis protein B
MRSFSIPIVSIVGRSDAGKTTLLEKVIPELKRRGYRVATVKHHAHPGFEIDRPGKDTWRYAQAGSDHVVIAAPDKVASIRRVAREPTLDEIVAGITDVDIILTEGYKWAGKPKIEVVRSARSREPICGPDELMALVTDVPFDLNVPQFGLEDVAGLADLIEQRFLTGQSHVSGVQLRCAGAMQQSTGTACCAPMRRKECDSSYARSKSNMCENRETARR